MIGILVLIIIFAGIFGSSKSNTTTKKDVGDDIDIEKVRQKFEDKKISIELVKKENLVDDKEIYRPFKEKILIEGYLLKKGHGNLVNKFQRRYCIIYCEPPKLRIYESMVPSFYGNVYVNEKQSYNLDALKGVKYIKNKDTFEISLNITDSEYKVYEPGNKKRIITFKCEGVKATEDAKKWSEAFRNYKNLVVKPIKPINCPRPLIINNDGKYGETSLKLTERILIIYYIERCAEISIKAKKKLEESIKK